MRKVIGLGAGGHAKVIIEILRAIGGYLIVGLVDSNQKLWDTEVLGVPVLGDDTLLPKLRTQGIENAFIGLGTVGDIQPRKRLYEEALKQKFEIVQAIHPRATIAPSAEIGLGVTIMPGAMINSAARLGDNIIINTGAIVEHDCVIEDHVHISPGAQLASSVHVGEGSHIGIGSTIIQCINIGDSVVVGAGAVVIKDVPSNLTVVGSPAHVLYTN